MPIAFVAGNGDGGHGVQTVTAIDTLAADFLVAVMISNSVGAVPTDSEGNTWNALTAYDATATSDIQIYWATPGAKVSATHTFSGVTSFGYLAVYAFSGVAQSSVFDVEAGGNFTSGTSAQPGSVTPDTNGSLLVAGFSQDGAVTSVSVNSGFTKREDVPFTGGSNYGHTSATLIQASAAAINPTFSWTSNTAGNIAIAVFRPAVGVGANPHGPLGHPFHGPFAGPIAA